MPVSKINLIHDTIFFIKDDLIGGTLFAAGIASAIFLIVHAILQIAFAYYFNPATAGYFYAP